MSVFNVGLFKGPRYSSFDWSHGNRISMDAGRINVIASDYLNTGDKFVLNDVSDVVRQMPMLAPTMDTYKVDVHAFAVRLRSIGNVARNPWSYEDFFNVQGNVDGDKRLPSIPLGLAFSANGLRNGTLFEQLGFPTFKKDRDDYLSWLRQKYPWVFDSVVTFMALPGAGSGQTQGFFVPSSFPSYDTSGVDGYPYLGDISRFPHYSLNGDYYYNPKYVSGGSDSNGLSVRGSLVGYIAEVYPEVFNKLSEILGSISGYKGLGVPVVYTTGDTEIFEGFVGTNLLEKVYELYKVDAISVMHDFEEWLIDGFLSLLEGGTPGSSSDDISYLGAYGYDVRSVFAVFRYILYEAFPDLPVVSIVSGFVNDRLIPAYPFEAYWKVISDWFLNTAVVSEPDNYFLSKVMDSSLYNHAVPDFWINYLKNMNQLAYRYWSNDYFTSAFPSAQIGNAVSIPVNGTIIDLRNANAMQKLRERLLYAGSRIRDVWFAIWGKKTSSAILEMSEVLGAWSNDINVDSVMQTSAADAFSPLAQYAGVGLGYRSGSKGFVYHAEEPTFILFVASIKPRASYFQGMPRKLIRGNLYDYAIPQLANVGEQSILKGELYLGSDSPVSGSQVFGYTRRNGDFMWTPDEVHGDFRASLDYWHNARIFGSLPSLSESFLQIRPVEDNLNRVFAVQSDSYNHFLCHFRFDGYVVRSLPKHVVYDL